MSKRARYYTELSRLVKEVDTSDQLHLKSTGGTVNFDVLPR